LALDPKGPPTGLKGAVLAIGNFDGAHLGHRAVIERTQQLAAELAAPSAILTFEPHPADFFAGRPVAFRLTPQAAKARALEAFGLDGAVVLTFDAKLAALSAEAFVSQVLVGRLGVAAVVIGRDFHFGKGRAGSPAFLKEAGARYGFRVDIIEKVEAAEGAEAISSTAIRRALEAGDVEGAARLLGRDYTIVGAVIAGRKLGRELGVPTANIALEPSNRLAYGVYAVEVRVDGRRYGGVASYGTRRWTTGRRCWRRISSIFPAISTGGRSRSPSSGASAASKNSTASRRSLRKWSATRQRRGRFWRGARVRAGLKPRRVRR